MTSIEIDRRMAIRAETIAYNLGNDLDIQRKRELIYLSIRSEIPVPEFPQAVCSSTDAEIFFPERGMNSHVAKAICRTCPEMVACRDFAVTHGIPYGIWGGTSEADRRELRKLMYG